MYEAIKQLLIKAFGKVVVSEAGEVQEAVRLVQGQSLDMAILDINPPGGKIAGKWISHEGP